MGLSLKPDHLRRYKDIAALLLKYGRSDLVLQPALAATDEDRQAQADQASDAARTGAELADDLEKLGPTFVKVGQLLSTRGDLLPERATQALGRLQDQVEPFSFADVEKIVADDLGVRISKAFAEFDAHPIAAASLGQVHRAALRDGRPVAVKVQRPGVRDTVARDIATMEEVAGFLDRHTGLGRRYQFSRVVEEFRRTLLTELDYRREAQHLRTIACNLAAFDRIVVPAPVEDLCSPRVLTMDYVRGGKVTALHPVVRIDLDGDALAEELFRAYLHQIVIDGVFHADPHPGNVFLTDDGRLALIDLGMVGRLSPDTQDRLLRLLLAIADGRSDQAADLAIQMGERLDDFDEPLFRRHVADVLSESRDLPLEEIRTGRLMLDFTRASIEQGMRLPQDLTLLGKTLLNLDEVGRTLSPRFDVNGSLRRNAPDLMRRRMQQALTPAAMFNTLVDVRDFAGRLPGRVNRVLDSLANQELRLKVEMIDEGAVIEGLQKVANRITLGLLLAATIVGAALLMRVDTPFRIFGYPGFAMLFFLVAAAGAAWLAYTIVHHDRGRRLPRG